MPSHTPKEKQKNKGLNILADLFLSSTAKKIRKRKKKNAAAGKRAESK